jgi:hypothetical protein
MKTPPRSPEIESLLAPHRAILPIAASLEARAMARAAAAVASPEQGAGRVSAGPRWVFAAAAGAVFALAAAASAAGAWIVMRSAPAAPDVAAPKASVPRARAVVPDAPEIEAPAPLAPPAAPHTTRRIAAKPSGALPTNAELQLLRAAREDATRGDFAGALAVIAEHVRRFRNGALVEEREALRVKSLAGLGRHREAQRAAAQFHARFPHSVFLSTFSTFERMKEADR